MGQWKSYKIQQREMVQEQPHVQAGVVENSWENSFVEKDLGVLGGQQVGHETAMCPWSTEGQWHAEQPSEHCQQVRGQ